MCWYMKIISISDLFNMKSMDIRDELLTYIHDNEKKLSKLLKEYKEKKSGYFDIIKYLMLDTYNFNVYNSFVGLKILTTSDNDFWNGIDEKMSISINELYSNKELYIVIDHILKHEKINKSFVQFLVRNIMSFKKRGIDKNRKQVVKIGEIINKKVRDCMDILNSSNKISIDRSHLNDKSVGKVTLNLNLECYYFLINSIDNPTVRKKIQSIYESRSEHVLEDICKIICLRQHYAKELEHKSFFDYVNKQHHSSKSINDLIKDISKRTDAKAREELERIYSEINKDNDDKNNKKVDSNDIIYCHNELQNKVMFRPSYIMGVLFDLTERYFGIVIKPCKRPKWNKTVRTFSCTMNNAKIGILYLDLITSHEKKIDAPMFIKLTDKYALNGSTQKAHVALLGNYKSYNAKCINYSDIVLLFGEFGHVIQNIAYKSHTGLINYDNTFANFMPQVMNYLVWEESTVKKIAEGCSEEIIDHILSGKDIDMCYTIKLKCIQAMIDHIIHNSPEYIIVVDKLVREKNKEYVALVKDLYRQIYKDIFSEVSDIFNIECDNIPPNVIVPIINGSEGALYGGIISDIQSYAVYYTMKDGNGLEFVDKVLKHVDKPFHELLMDYIGSKDIEPYELYLNNVLDIDLGSTESEETNCYNDETEMTEINDKDVHNIIMIDE